MSTSAKINGEKPHSATLNHIISYPLVADGVTFYQQNSLGAKSIALFHSAYSKLAVPVLPYLQTPYSYVSPYLSKADHLGDDTLSHVDARFPSIKTTDFGDLKSQATAIAYFPFKLAGDGKEYVFKTYDDEYKKTAVKGDMSIVHTGKAVISTELKIAVDAIQAVADWLGPKKDEAKQQFEHIKKKGHEKANQIK